MANVISFPCPSTIRAEDIRNAPEPSDRMVWEICPYLRDKPCHGCPRTEHVEHHGEATRGCRVLAEEACRVVMAVQKIESES